MIKKKVNLVLLGMVLVSFFSMPIYADQLSQRNPSEDVWTQQELPNTNHGSDTSLYTLGTADGHRNIVLKFDITDIKSDVSQANVTMFLHDFIQTHSVQPFYAANQTWNEDQIVYANQNTTLQDYGVPGEVLSPGTTGWFTWDITEIVQHAVDQGDSNVTLFINATGGTSGNYNQYYSKEFATAGQRPYINITHSGEEPVITITNPQNITYYGITEIELNFSATDPDNSTFTLNATLNGVQVYANETYQNGTFIIQTNDTAVDTNNFTVVAFDGENTITETVIFDVFYGLNLSAFNINGTAITTWNLFATNGTDEVSILSNTNPTTFRYSDLPNGTTNVTINNSNSNFDNQTITFEINSSMGIVQQDFELYRNQFFYAINGDTGIHINSFGINFTNGTSTLNLTTTDGQLEASLRSLPFGITNLTIFAQGFNQTTDQLDFNISSAINNTYNLTSAGISITVFDEKNTSLQLIFDLIMTNTTGCSVSGSNLTEFSDTANNLCLGFNTITISNNSFIEDSVEFEYPARNYFLTISNTSTLSLTGYILREDKGINHAFTVTTFAGSPIEGAIVTARRSIGGTFVPVEQGQTDTGGSTTLFLDPTVTYQIIVEADGFVSSTFSLNPSTINTQTFVKLQETGEAGANIINVTTLFDSISFSVTPAELLQNGSFNIVFFISDSNSSLENFGMNVTFRNTTFNFSELVFNQTSTSPSGATISFNTSGQVGWYDVVIFFEKDGFDEYVHPTITYYVSNGTGIPGFNIDDGLFHFNTWRLIGLFIIALSAAFFMAFGFLAGMFGGLSVFGILTFGFNIFPWEWFALTSLLVLSMLILFRRI